ncbi:putative membrane protein (DUF2339) [Mycobacteroides abscessus subsp. bolletii]|uniref:DUF2339 domain-containing protein n=1 Tax=Mycobacteroides abscessus TaxID=36809 RepID=UPI0009A8A710|nr:DUF2339 domain-containing protein [Mycobacteroides abscessus]SLI36481.1 putative membrane protein (DUF2339) [Mycobacteroides abscessus subsp. bolletii]
MFSSYRAASTLRGMTDPQLQQMTATLDELDGRERALRAEVDALRGRMIEWTQAEYLKAQRYWDDYRRAQGVAQAVAPAPAVVPPARMPVPAHAAHPAPPQLEPLWMREGFASKAMALVGAVVTLAGVVMLLVLAAKSGYFGPVPRMVSGAVLAGGLVALGIRVYSRPGGRVGGIATAATGFAAAFFDVLALTVIYDKIPVVAGLVLGLGIAGVGLVLARHWNSQPFASGVVAAITVLAPFLTDGFTVELAAFALILLIASLTAQVGRNWPVLHAFRTVGVSLTLLAATHVSYTASLALLAMSAMALLVTLVGSLWLLTGEHDDITSSVMIAVASSPVLYGALFFPVWPLGVLVPVGVAVVMGAVLLLVGALPVHARITVAAVAGVALLQASVDGARDALLAVVLLAIALSCCAIGYQLRDRVALVLGQVFGGLGTAVYLAYVRPELLTDSPSAVLYAGPLLVLASVLMAATVGMVLVTMARVGWASPQSPPTRAVLAGVSMLYSGTAAVVLSGTALLGNNDGFLLGHGLATVSWMAVSVALLLAGLRRYRGRSWVTRTGFVLAAMAVAKLFLFDLATLDGVARIGAFIVTGLLLLGGGTLYAREYATRSEELTAERPVT